MEGLFKRQQAGADIEPGALIINAVLGRTRHNNHHSNNPGYPVEINLPLGFARFGQRRWQPCAGRRSRGWGQGWAGRRGGIEVPPTAGTNGRSQGEHLPGSGLGTSTLQGSL